MSRRTLITLCALMVSVVSFAADAPIRLAILSGDGDRAPAEEVIAQLEVALTENKEITLLERAQVRKILAEQNLSATGLTDPATAVKLGKLLAVEMFLFLERIPGGEPPGYRVQVIETSTGIAMAAALVEMAALGGEGGALRDAIRRAIATHAVPLGARRYVGLLGIRNEDPDHAFDGIAETLWTLLPCDLQDCPGVVLLDREHLQRLTEEKQLTDVEQTLKLSAVLIDGGLRRSAAPDKLELNLLLRSLAGEEPERLSLTFAPASLSAFRRELIAALAQRLNTKPPERPAMSPAAEAKSFLAQGLLLDISGDEDAALRAREAAYNLWPDSTTRLALVWAYSRNAYDWQALYKLPEEEIRRLRNSIRMLTLVHEQYQADRAPGASVAEDTRTQWQHLEQWQSLGFGIVIREATPEIGALQKEAAFIRRKILDIFIDDARQDPEKNGYAYLDALRKAVARNSGSLRHPEELAASWRELFTIWSKGPIVADVTLQRFGASFRTELRQFDTLSQPDKAEIRALFVPVFKECSRDPNQTISLTAHAGLVFMDPSAVDSAETFMQYFAEGIDWKIYAGRGDMPDLPAAGRAAGLLCEQRPERAGAYCEQIIRNWTKHNVLNMAMHFDRGRRGIRPQAIGIFDNMVRATEKSKGKVEAVALCDRVLDCLREGPDRTPNEQRDADIFIAEFEALRAELVAGAPAAAQPAPAPKSKVEPQADDPWNQYELRSLGLERKTPVRAAAVRDDRLYCISCNDGNVGQPGVRRDDGLRQVTVSVHKFPEGGPALRTDMLAVPLLGGPFSRMDVWTGFIGDCLYVSTDGTLARFPGNAPPSLLTEDDGWFAKTTPISAMASLDDKLYMATGGMYAGAPGAKCAFVVFDPSARLARTIFSNTALEDAQRRQGLVTDIVPDVQRKCLWLRFFGMQEPSSIFRYDPQADKVERIAADNATGLPFAATLCPAGLLYTNSTIWKSGPGTMDILKILDTQTLTETHLMAQGFGPPRAPREGDPPFGFSDGPMASAWYDGTTLISIGELWRGGFLYLHRKDAAPARSRKIAGVPLLQSTPHGLLAFDHAGEGYLIRRIPGASGEPPLKLTKD